MKSRPNIQLCWIPYEIPILQYSICLIQTVIAFYPNTVWGPGGVFYFNTIVLIFMLSYLIIRFTWVTEEHGKITECDSIIIQTVVFVVAIEYIYHELLRVSST